MQIVLHTFAILRDQPAISERMKKYHRTMTRVLIVQVNAQYHEHENAIRWWHRFRARINFRHAPTNFLEAFRNMPWLVSEGWLNIWVISALNGVNVISANVYEKPDIIIDHFFSPVSQQSLLYSRSLSASSYSSLIWTESVRNFD